MTLHGDSSSDDVMYRLKIKFATALPERFDFTPPEMIVRGKKYPVRTYTYRLFKEQKTYGLCT